MGILRIMGSTGDQAVAWDVRKAETGDPEAKAAVREAERIFKKHQSRGAQAFVSTPARGGGKIAERIDQFDPQAEEIVIVPRMMGG